MILSWRSLDRGIWEPCFGSDEESAAHAPCPREWRERAPSTKVAMMDHAPVGLTCTGESKVFFAKQEFFTAAMCRRMRRKIRQAVAASVEEQTGHTIEAQPILAE